MGRVMLATTTNVTLSRDRQKVELRKAVIAATVGTAIIMRRPRSRMAELLDHDLDRIGMGVR
jgi:hypothetical protein